MWWMNQVNSFSLVNFSVIFLKLFVNVFSFPEHATPYSPSLSAYYKITNMLSSPKDNSTLDLFLSTTRIEIKKKIVFSIFQNLNLWRGGEERKREGSPLLLLFAS